MEELSSLERRGSMERTTLATGRGGSEDEESGGEEDGGDWRARETSGGHFISHIALSALLVSKNALLFVFTLLLLFPLLLPLLLLLLLASSSMAPHRERERERENWKKQQEGWVVFVCLRERERVCEESEIWNGFCKILLFLFPLFPSFLSILIAITN